MKWRFFIQCSITITYEEHVFILEDGWINQEFLYKDSPVKTDFQVIDLSVSWYVELVQMSGKMTEELLAKGCQFSKEVQEYWFYRLLS